jgi:DNA uptake protein ComE-like DNA-binding protein
MDPIRKNLLEALNFSAGEKRGLLVMAVLMLLICFVPDMILQNYYQGNEVEEAFSYTEFLSRPASSEKKEHSLTSEVRIYSDFDPNVISANEMARIGFPEFLIVRIEKYRKAGGKFKTKEDLNKIYGMKRELYEKLEAHIKIPEERIIEKREDLRAVKREYDINLADSTALKSLKGIGPVFAQRIIKYRQALGGFVNIDQIREVYGFSDSLFLSLKDQLKLDTLVVVRKININQVDLSQLKKHPYFREHPLSNALINYRKMNGYYTKLEDLKKVHLMNDSILIKIEPYLTFE